MKTQEAEDMITRIAEMTRNEAASLLKELPCSFRIDFTDDYLNAVSLEQLRHIALAAYLHTHDPRKSPV